MWTVYMDGQAMSEFLDKKEAVDCAIAMFVAQIHIAGFTTSTFKVAYQVRD